MAVKGKGKQAVRKAPASAAESSSGKRKAVSSARPSGEGAKRKARRPGVLQFFDDAAVDTDSDCEEEDLEMEADEHQDLDDSKFEDENLRGTAKSHRLPFFIKEEELSGDELEELIKERYSNGSGYVRYNDGSAEGDDRVSETDELKDVIIWKVKCMVGRERQVAFCLMQKYIEMHNFGTKMPISSSFSIEHVKGYVFVEADKLKDIIEACKGFCNVYSSRVNLVPRSEIPSLLACRNKLSEVSIGTWVRMRSGNYKGDLAKVVSVDDGRKRVIVKLVPRIDLQAIAKKFGGGVSLKLAAVPAPRLISSRELEIFRPHIELRRDRQTGEIFEVLDGLMLKDGYLYKKVSIASLIFWGVEPSNSELLMFSDANKDVAEDLSWLSNIYNARKKKPLTEPSDDKVSAVTKNGYGLHDLVLFGRKNFGVIVAIEKDYFKVLRGDIEGVEVLPVKIQEIKSACDDRMFTALDSKGETIFIDDIVKTSVGSSEGREGSVKHMYKGTLFIQVEDETENCEFFCAKSKSCVKTNESKGYHGAKSGKGKGEQSSSFLQSPVRIDDQENDNYNDNARGSTRHQRNDYEQTFSIGQTLRIREGPLKGYLCRVVGMYRSDITVKLDSLVKLITVKEKSLAVPKLKGDSSFAPRSSDHFSHAVTSFGETSEKSPWESVVPSFDRDSWQPFSSSDSAGWNNDKKTGHDDPWGSKPGSAAKADAGSGNAWDGWAKQPASSTDQGHDNDPWGNKVGSAAKTDSGSGNALDEWGKQPASSTGHGADPWSKAMGSSTDKGQTADPWSSKVTSSVGPKDGWGEPSNSCVPEKTKTWEKKSDDWNKSSSDDKTARGDESELPVNGAEENWAMGSDKKNNASSWDSKEEGKLNSRDDPWSIATKPQEKINDSSDGAASGWTQPNNSWGNKGKEKVSTEEESWGKSEKSQEKNDEWNNVQKVCTQSTAKHGSQEDSWDRLVSSKSNDSSWQKGTDKERVTSNDQMDNWNKPNNFGGPQSANTENENWSQGGGWNKNQDGGQPSWKSDKDQKDDDGGQSNNRNNWSRQRDVDGDRGNCWGRGRDRQGGRSSTGFDAGGEERWSSGTGGNKGRGSGRGGHFGEVGGKRNTSDEGSTFGQNQNWGSKSACATQTSDWKKQQNCGIESWSNDKNAISDCKWSSANDKKDAGWQSGWNDGKKSGVEQPPEACDKIIKGDWDKPQPNEPQNDSNAWDIKGKRTIAEDDQWGRSTYSQEKTTGKTDDWCDNSEQNKEMPMPQGRNQISNWDTSIERSSQVGSWEKASSAGNSDQWKVASQKTDTDSGGWNQEKSWDKPKSFGEESNSDWNKIWNKAEYAGRGRGRTNRNDYNNSWNKPMENVEGRGGNDEAGGDQGRQWNRQSDFGGGRGSSSERGRGPYRPRGRDEGDNSGGPPNQEGGWRGRGGRGRGWGSGRGRGGDSQGRGRGGDSQGRGHGGDSQGRGHGGDSQGRGRGRFFSSGRNGDRENSGRGSFSRNPTSTWGTGESKGWSSSWSNNNSGNGRKEENLAWNPESSSGRQSAWDN